MQKIIEDTLSYKMSYGFVLSLRPFFVTLPSDRETLECLCAICFNCCQLLNALMCYTKKNNFKVFDSITAYFTRSQKCTLNRNGYLAYDCIVGDCKKCNLVNPHDYPTNSIDTVTYQFESGPTGNVQLTVRQPAKTIMLLQFYIPRKC